VAKIAILRPRSSQSAGISWGEYQGFRDKSLPSNPHQEFQLVPGQIGTRPALDPTDVVRAGEPARQARPPLQRHDPALQEIVDHVH
jgi:hypothetical protein